MCTSNASVPAGPLWGASRLRHQRPATLKQLQVPGVPMSEDIDSRPAVARCAFCGKLTRVNLARLDTVIGGTQVPVLVDFYADWCGPCKIIAPLLDQLAQERAGRAMVLKLDTDRHPNVSMRYGVRGIPTLIAFKGGKESGRKV